MNNNIDKHKFYMNLALQEAVKADCDVPVGAVLVVDGKVIASAHNEKELNNDPTAHAEMIVIKKASKILGNWRLENASLYVTLEPCPMCASAILYSRIPNIYFGAYDSLYGAFGSAFDMRNYIKFYPKIVGGIQEEAAKKLIKEFFEKQRV